MAYRLDPGAPLDAEFRRIAGEQIRKAEKGLGAGEGDRHAAVHDARKRMKKLRGLLRLVRDARPAFHAKENARFRDAARKLSGARDSGALIEALDQLEAHYADELATDAFGAVRRELTERRTNAEKAEMGPAVEQVLRSLGAARHKLDGFVIGRKSKAGDAATIVASGIARSYGRGRAALATAQKTREVDAFHELRKRAKYHWMHLRLVGPLWPDAMKPLAEAGKQIGDSLGLDHDYAVLREQIAATPDAFGTSGELAVVLALADRRQTELRESALDMARQLFADDPDGVETRIKRLYRAGAGRAARDPAAPASSPSDSRRRAG
ncbi:CHAD domain-containing protein [Aurantimonas sp. A2-1-M11]|uniref:CHAD domain-containing protein n=1 Tax=Aurantimonas sp. A2-1-M11 TaxID=3113712 RepID=UPI002F95648A